MHIKQYKAAIRIEIDEYFEEHFDVNEDNDITKFGGQEMQQRRNPKLHLNNHYVYRQKLVTLGY